jgi:hypothetical protein
VVQVQVSEELQVSSLQLKTQPIHLQKLKEPPP